jgi:CTP:molybdopterin cytidylyltransferase MocA
MSTSSLYAVVLAAGKASRFGSTKQIAIFAGQPLVTRAVRTAEFVCGPRSVLVTGNDWIKVAAACAPLQGFMVLNPDFSEGLATSLATGIRSLSGLASGALLLLADQPLVTGSHVRLLVDSWEASPDSICASSYAGTVGPPVIFPARYFSELSALRGDRGAKTVMDANRNDVISIRLDEAAVDIDSPDDLLKIQ